MKQEYETIIVGGGVVGAAIGYGLAKLGRRTAIVDGGDGDVRASRTNFGLIWVQGKGDGFAPYQRLTRQSADLWPAFSQELQTLTGVDLEYRRNGGLLFCLSEAEAAEETSLAERMASENPGYSAELIDRARIERMLPGITLGPKVCAASFSAMDGDVNPLLVLRALLDGFGRLGGTLKTGQTVKSVTPAGSGYQVMAGETLLAAEQVIIAAGNDTMSFAEPLDLPVHVEAERGQLLITERVAPIFPYAASGVRQTARGTFQLGATNERVGRSLGTTPEGARSIAQRAINIFPALGDLRVVRQWAGLRVLSPDGFPIYDQSRTHRGIHVVVCHSGVTLAAVHAGPFANWLVQGGGGPHYVAFRGDRFEMGAAA